MAETLQAIYLRDYETRTEPKPHTVFRIEVHAAVRSWSIWKRYSEFEQLHARFLELFPDHPPPMALPIKHWWQTTLDNPELLEERRAGLESYLRGILSHRDDRWRLTHEWNEFLAVPVGRSQANLFAGGPGVHGPAATGTGRDSPAPSLLSHLNFFGLGGGGGHASSESPVSPSPVLNPGPAPQYFTTESWLEEYRTLQGMAREVRSLINRRETHLGRNEISASHNCTIQSKKLLTNLGLRIPTLENGLLNLAMGQTGGGGKGSVMSDGELRRRTDMLAELKDEREVLTKLVLANRQNDGIVGGYQGAAGNVPASSGDRNALLVDKSSSAAGGSNSQPGSLRGMPDNRSLAESTYSGNMVGGSLTSSSASSRMNPRRVFGRVVQNLTQETSQTRGLDNEGLLILQQEQMKQQDDHIEQFNAILQRQKHIGLAIGQELDNQNQLLDELDRDVDRTTLKLGLVNKKIGKIN
ncbi:regulator of vacuolar morphogenesis [Entomortierella parvispora]|uniref:Regulator of vacuolar morphogenesis n=1 Tax=Entomortierella parvispora TaxID=205924 RepID=A0A9P3HJV6_9FUNG|nr:regulator of vacuolar morphogenesis [Entomortierella parvispora]